MRQLGVRGLRSVHGRYDTAAASSFVVCHKRPFYFLCLSSFVYFVIAAIMRRFQRMAKDGTSFLCTVYIFWRRESSFNGTHPHRIMFLLECCCCLQKSPPHEFDLGLSVQHLRETSHYFKPLKKKIMHLSKAHTRIFPPSRFVAPFFDPFLGSSLIS